MSATLHTGDLVGISYFKLTLVLIGAAIYTFVRKNNLKNVDKSFVGLLIVYFTVKAIEKKYHSNVWLSTGDTPFDMNMDITPSFLLKVLILINAKKISKGTTQIIILNIISKLLSTATKMGYLASGFGSISLAIEGYLFYLLPNKNIFDFFYFPTKLILTILGLYMSKAPSTDTIAFWTNVIEILEAFYFARIVYLD